MGKTCLYLALVVWVSMLFANPSVGAETPTTTITTTPQGVELKFLSNRQATDFRIAFDVDQNQGVWGLVFNYLDDSNFCMINFYPEKGRVYQYRKVKDSFIEVHHTQFESEATHFQIEKTGSEIVITTPLKSLKFQEPFFKSGKIGLRTENTKIALTLSEFEILSTPDPNRIAFDEEAFLNDYLPKMESTMLFYDFSKPLEDFHFCQIRGETTCRWENGALLFTFPHQFDTWMAFHKDVSGYSGMELQGTFSSPGKLSVIMSDRLDRIYHWETQIASAQSSIRIPFAELKSEQQARLTTLERILFKFVPDEKKDIQTFHLKKIQPFDPNPMNGPWVAVDPLFAYYKFSPWERTAKVLKNAGFLGAEIISIKDEPGIEEQKKMVEAFHKEGLMCILRVYPTTDFDAFKEHPSWRQVTLDGSSEFDWRVYLCPNSDEFTAFIAEKTRAIVEGVPYDAIELSEPWFEIWGGPYPENDRHGKYACLCENCRNKFKTISGVDPLELFDKDGPRYFLKDENKPLYEKWMDFRVDTIIDFSRKLYEAAKSARPDIKIVHMHLSDCTVEPGRIREYQAQDFEKAIQVLNPDAIIIEDAWQDWEKPDTPPEFIVEYGKYYLDKIRKVSPTIKVFGHADIGSIAQMQRSYSWMRAFSAHAQEVGFDGVDYYEFTIGDFSQ